MDIDEHREATIEKLTKMSKKERKILLRYFAKLPLRAILYILTKHRKLLFILNERTEYESLETVSFAALVLAIKSYYSDDKKLSQKKFIDLTIDEIHEISIRSILLFEEGSQSKRPQRDKLLSYWSVVISARKNGKSSRFIAMYLKKKYQFKVGHDLINRTWNELKTQEKENNEK